MLPFLTLIDMISFKEVESNMKYSQAKRATSSQEHVTAKCFERFRWLILVSPMGILLLNAFLFVVFRRFSAFDDPTLFECCQLPADDEVTSQFQLCGIWSDETFVCT